MSTRRNDTNYVRRRDALRRATIKNGWPCHLCGQPFDLTLPYNDRMAWSADHLDAVGNGGSMTGRLAPAHRHCNSSRGKKSLEEYRGEQEAKAPGPVRRTTRW